MSGTPWELVCIETGVRYPGDSARQRSEAGGLLQVEHDFSRVDGSTLLETFDARRASKDAADRSGVWRFRELVLPVDPAEAAARGEGNTGLYASDRLAAWAGMDGLLLKHEGENPTGSFKDRGMTAGVTMARRLGMKRVACASTGNTSASMASYAALFGMEALVFIPEGKIAMGKLSQALAYGAKTIQIAGSFDDAMTLVEQVCAERGVYLLNSINPFRIEGQKAIGIELLQDLAWEVPDWIVVPGGNLGNNTAIFKGLIEMKGLGLIDRIPRIAVVQASGANPLYRAFSSGGDVSPLKDAETIATAIRIGNPVSWRKSLRGIVASKGIVEEATDQEIMDAKAQVDASGIGAEPASCASVAGLKKLIGRGVIRRDERVVCILTGHVLKDPDAVARYHTGSLEGIMSNHANAPVRCDATLDAVLRAVDG